MFKITNKLKLLPRFAIGIAMFSFFICVFHFGSFFDHSHANTKEIIHTSCVDHQITLSPHSGKDLHADLTFDFLPTYDFALQPSQTSFNIENTSLLSYNYHEKIPIYIINEVYRL